MFWRSVEAIGSGARDVALRCYLSESYEQVRSYLIPCAELTQSIACERTLEGHYCKYRIADVPEEDGTYAAMCDEHFCPTKFYTREELVRYSINPQILVTAIARCLGLHPQVSSVADDVWQVGTLPAATERTAVLFTRVRYEDAMQRVLEALIIKGSRRFILVTPTARYLSEACQGLMARAESFSFPLDEVTEIVDHESVLTEAGRVLWQKVKEAIGGAIVLGATFPTPPGSAWHDLTLVFRDGHTLVASMGAVRKIYTFQDMGMVDRRTLLPDAQWLLLCHFAEEMGVFTWTSKHADHRNKKRKERLAAKLKAFFGIEEEPFAYRKEDGGWEAIFSVRTEH